MERGHESVASTIRIKMAAVTNPSLLLEKERDNTWLQVAVCPSILRKDAGTTDIQDATSEATKKPDDDKQCHDEASCPYAHPPAHVKILDNGAVVSCHDFVFAHSNGAGDKPFNRRGCSRSNCKYFHPPLHLRLVSTHDRFLRACMT